MDFPTEAAIRALAHGIPSGGQGLSAAEAMSEDIPLLPMPGLRRAPSAEKKEEVLKYLASENVAGEAGHAHNEEGTDSGGDVCLVEMV